MKPIARPPSYEQVVNVPRGSVSLALEARVENARGLGATTEIVDGRTVHRLPAPGAHSWLSVTVESVPENSRLTRIQVQEERATRARPQGWARSVLSRVRCRSLLGDVVLSARAIHQTPPRGPRGGPPAGGHRTGDLVAIPVRVHDADPRRH